MPSLFVARFRPLSWLAVVFLFVSMATRLSLLIATGDGVPVALGGWSFAVVVGFGYDIVALLYFASPLVLLLWLLPRGALHRRRGRWLVGALCFVLLAVALFVAVAEWTFWDEFRARFNFIAVDYLVYTTEVIGNVRESYPIAWILSGLGIATVAIFIATARWRRPIDDGAGIGARSRVAGAWIVAAVVATLLISGDLKDRTENTYVNELAGNGIYQFFAAFRSASLDYDRYYRSLPIDDAFTEVRGMLATPDATFARDSGIDRRIHNAAPERHLNVVLISIESLSASYSGTYGRAPSLTPRLDALTPESLVFANLIASGTRTVRGLEALALSVPPTPGESIVKRPHNENLFSLASVFNAKGYESQFLYGGYGAFDNMNHFFANNGYVVHDRQEIPDDAIHASNIWGVADEDLYTFALDVFEKTHTAGKPFFAHLMTTSNHRPYTFPEGRGPWPQGVRESAVAYTDWAIGDFIERARTKAWFKDTVFVITADHCASSAGKAALPVFRYHIPMWIYAPGIVEPGRFEPMIGQIDIAPTILGLLGMDYDSAFYGVDVLQDDAPPQRAFVGTYQLLGYLRGGNLVQLAPHGRVDTVRPAFLRDQLQPEVADDPALTRQAISYYQTAAYRFTRGAMRLGGNGA
jgi:phosphoglycerol transferase MdoB-like AlkP superfamily enzyme